MPICQRKGLEQKMGRSWHSCHFFSQGPPQASCFLSVESWSLFFILCHSWPILVFFRLLFDPFLGSQSLRWSPSRSKDSLVGHDILATRFCIQTSLMLEFLCSLWLPSFCCCRLWNCCLCCLCISLNFPSLFWGSTLSSMSSLVSDKEEIFNKILRLRRLTVEEVNCKSIVALCCEGLTSISGDCVVRCHLQFSHQICFALVVHWPQVLVQANSPRYRLVSWIHLGSILCNLLLPPRYRRADRLADSGGA